MYIISGSKKFQKQLKRLLVQNPKIKTIVSKTLHLLRNNPNHPSLRLHKLTGKSTWSVSVSMRIRIIFGIRGNKIYLLRIGSHDEVY